MNRPQVIVVVITISIIVMMFLIPPYTTSVDQDILANASAETMTALRENADLSGGVQIGYGPVFSPPPGAQGLAGGRLVLQALIVFTLGIAALFWVRSHKDRGHIDFQPEPIDPDDMPEAKMRRREAV